jgi:hypothetical protein
MVRCANLLFAFLVALAPGLSATRLAHSLELCVFAPAHVAIANDAHSGCTHDHGTQPERHGPDNCPHLLDMPQFMGAMNVTVPVPFDLPAPPTPHANAGAEPASLRVCASDTPERPPTGPPLVGCVLLRI